MENANNHNNNVEESRVPTLKRKARAIASNEEKVERLLQEINVLNLERFLFSTDRQNGAGPNAEASFTDSEGRQYHFRFGPHGQPGQTAYRLFHAATHHFVETARVCEGEVCSFQNFAAITKRHLTRLCGRSWSGASTDDDYHRAIMSLLTTFVSVKWYDKATDTTKEETFNLFTYAFFAQRGNHLHEDNSCKRFENCVYSVNPVILKNYSAGYFRAYNMARLMTLRCTGQMLYKRLFLAFGYLHKEKGIRKFEKDYDAICTDWLNQPVRRYRSKIAKHLEPHLTDLVTVGLLKEYTIQPKVRGEGYKVVFYPGEGFYADYDLFLETAAAALPMRAPNVTEDEPGKLVGYFHSKLGRTHGKFRSAELEQARKLLKTFTLDECEDLVDFALAEKSEKILPQVFGFVLGYQPQWEAQKAARMQARLWRKKTQTCTLCDTAGYLHYATEKRAQCFQACPHDRERVERWARENRHFVPSLAVQKEA